MFTSVESKNNQACLNYFAERSISYLKIQQTITNHNIRLKIFCLL